MKKVGVVPNVLRDKYFEVTNKVIESLANKGLEVYVVSTIGSHIKAKCHQVEEEDLYRECEVIIAIGGDGTLLGVAQKASFYHKPILGINIGRLGFLADVEKDSVDDLLGRLLEEPYELEERLMICVEVEMPNGEVESFHALNDITVTRGNGMRMTEFEIRVNEDFVDIYPADGIIVATPTGSTAYNLSAGGPIVSPHADVMILTPICPHTIYARSIVLASDDKIFIQTHNTEGPPLTLSVDGQTKLTLTPKHHIKIKKADVTTKLIKLSGLHFFEILRKKIVERR